MNFWRKAFAITRKDALSEFRTKEIIASVLVFVLLVIITFNFAFGADQDAMRRVAPGILWVTFTFAGVLSLNRSFVTEMEQDCLEGLKVCPASREVIYVGKVMGSLLFMLIIEAISLPLFAALFNLPVLNPQVLLITFLATVGFVAVGTLFSALSVNTRAREMVLPILFLPIIVPVVISAVKASELAITGVPWGELSSWLTIIIAFDAVFLVVAFFVFSFVIEE